MIRYEEEPLGVHQERNLSLQEGQQEQTLTGENAHREISAKLSNYPLAQRLAREIYNFYGDYLSYTESGHFPSTIFVIKLQHAPVTLESAEIRLQLGTERAAEALTHELLHLRLPLLGFPLGEFVNVPLPLDPYAREFLGMCHWVLNLVQHEMNYQSFNALGFDRNHFLAMPGEIMDYQDLFARKARNGCAPEVDFPCWCMEYLRHWCSARHGCNHHSLDQAQEALDWGSRLYPEMKEVVAKIRKWIENGAFKTPCQYPQQVNFLLELMGIPKFVSWVNLQFSKPQKPVAIRLNFTGTTPEACRERDFRNVEQGF